MRRTAGRRVASRLALGCLAGALAGSAAARALPVETLGIDTATGASRFHVEIARTFGEREHGLMFRKSLAADRGMLFEFDRPQEVAFWMKNTLIPLDMLFIGADGRIVSIARDATPLSETPIPSGGPVTAVLEIRGGRAAQIGAQPGDRVRERFFSR